MYSPTFDKHIELQEEKNAIIEFCNEFWTIKEKKEDLVSMVDFLFDFGAKLANNKYNASELNLFMMEVKKAAMKKMKAGSKNDEEIHNYNKKSNIYFSISDVDRMFNDQEYFQYDNYMPKLLKEVKSQFTTLKTVKPVDWKKYLNDPNSVDDHYKIGEFKGSKSSVGMYIWRSFPESHTLSSIEYNDERGRKPFETLVSSIINQAYASQIHNNTVEIIAELNTIIHSKQIDQLELHQISPTILNNALRVIFEFASFDDNKNDSKEEKKFKEAMFSTLMPVNIPTKKLKR